MCKRKRNKLVHQNYVNYQRHTYGNDKRLVFFAQYLMIADETPEWYITFYFQTIEFTQVCKLNKTKSRLMPNFEDMLMLRNNFKTNLIVVRHKNRQFNPETKTIRNVNVVKRKTKTCQNDQKVK